MLLIQQRAFGLGGRESILQLIVAVAGPIALALVFWGRLPAIAYAAVVLMPTPALMAGMAMRLRTRWPAQDVLFWLDESVRSEWSIQDLGKQPRNPSEARAWLAAHPEGIGPQRWRASMLIAAGRPADARAAIAGLPTATAHDRSRRHDLELVADAYEGLPLDATAADAAMTADPDETPVRTAVVRAYHAALVSIADGGDGLSRLASVRPGLGRLSSAVRRRLALVRLQFVIISALIGVWVLACVLVALASSSGLVWF